SRRGVSTPYCPFGIVPERRTDPSPRNPLAAPSIARRRSWECHARSGIREPIALISVNAGDVVISIFQRHRGSSISTVRLIGPVQAKSSRHLLIVRAAAPKYRGQDVSARGPS